MHKLSFSIVNDKWQPWYYTSLPEQACPECRWKQPELVCGSKKRGRLPEVRLRSRTERRPTNTSRLQARLQYRSWTDASTYLKRNKGKTSTTVCRNLRKKYQGQWRIYCIDLLFLKSDLRHYWCQTLNDTIISDHIEWLPLLLKTLIKILFKYIDDVRDTVKVCLSQEQFLVLIGS